MPTKLINGIQKEPYTMIIYGVPGVGKTSLARGAKNSVLLGPENHSKMPGLKFPQSTTHAMIMAQSNELANGLHKGIEPLIFDAITTQEKIIHEEIVKSEPNKTMETARKGYGKAYKESAARLTEIRDKLELVKQKQRINIIVIGHSIKEKFSDPLLNIDYDVYEMTLHKGKKFDHNSIFVNWADCVLFLNWITFATEDGNHAVSSGYREILTEFRAGHLAKNRYNFPYRIQMDHVDPFNTFSMIEEMIDKFYQSGGVTNNSQNNLNLLLHETKGLLSQVKNEQIKEQATIAANNSSNNYDELNVIKNRLREIVNNQ